MLWEYSDRDLRTLVKVRFGQHMAEQSQQLENLFKVAKAIFGKKEKEAPKSFEELAAGFRAFGVVNGR